MAKKRSYISHFPKDKIIVAKSKEKNLYMVFPTKALITGAHETVHIQPGRYAHNNYFKSEFCK